MPNLVDNHGRTVTYIRLSVTDRCDLRCQYCLPERPNFLPKSRVLSLAQLLTIATEFTELGVSKIRVTGGEPLVRRDLPWLLERISALPGLKELTLTTNGTRLATMAQVLKDSGVARLNISLDTLSPSNFSLLTRNGDLSKVKAGIAAAARTGFSGTRINTVLLPGINSDELCDLARFAFDHNSDIAFIEEMPLGDLGRSGNDHRLDSASTLELLSRDFDLHACDYDSGGPASYWTVAGHTNKIGIIAPHTRNFCAHCNRVRISCTGDLHPCLGHDDPTPLDTSNRKRLRQLILKALSNKPSGHDFHWRSQPQVLRYMATTGG